MEPQPSKLEQEGVPNYALPHESLASSTNVVKATAQASDQREAHDAALEKVHEDKPCLFFELLPLELRRQIYRLLFKRPLRICPSNVRYFNQDKDRNWIGMPYLEYRYYWDGYAQPGGGFTGPHNGDPLLPKFNSFPKSYEAVWLTMPTPTQSMLIKSADAQVLSDEEILLPSFYDDDRGVQVHPKVLRNPGSDLFQIVNSATVVTTAIYGVTFLQTCRAAATEASVILYGDNKYSFDSTVNVVNSNRPAANDYDVFENATPGRIPGLKNTDRTSMTEQQLGGAIKSMFEPDPSLLKQPKFIRNDPLTRLCNQIGPINASLIKDVQLDGHFEIVPEPRKGRVGFAGLLPIYSTILHRAFHSLRNVTINVSKQVIYFRNGQYNDFLMAREASFDATMQLFVDAVPNMQQLQIGGLAAREPTAMKTRSARMPQGPRKVSTKVVHIYGKSLRFIKIVEDRHNERSRQELWRGLEGN